MREKFIPDEQVNAKKESVADDEIRLEQAPAVGLINGGLECTEVGADTDAERANFTYEFSEIAIRESEVNESAHKASAEEQGKLSEELADVARKEEEAAKKDTEEAATGEKAAVAQKSAEETKVAVEL